MDKAGFAQLIDAYADAKVSGNKILVKALIGEFEAALNSVFPEGQAEESTLGEVEITPE